MAYKFGTSETVQHALARVAREQLDRAVSELSEGINQDPIAAVHNARKAIKKERSLLRLARGAISGRERRRENAALREAARELSATRDADVLIASVDQLAKRFAGQLPARTFDALRSHFETIRAAANTGRAGSPLATHAVQELGSVRVRVDDWQLRKSGWNAIESGLLRSYGRGRKALAHATSTGDTADLHDLRKRVKDLWYHERLLAPICGGAVRGHAKELDRLAELLGDDHDLALLRDELTRHDPPIPVDLDAVITLIDHRRVELQTEAIRLAERAYAEPPKAFRRRMRRSWKAGRALARAPHERSPAELAAAIREPHTG